MKTGIPVGQVMRKKVIKTNPDKKISEVAKLMALQEIGSIIITNNEQVLGILTEQDLARNVIAKDVDPKTTEVSVVMTRELHYASPEDDLYDAMLKMGENKIKHLPVLKDGKLDGIISFKDIINIEPDLIDMLSFKSSLTDKEKKQIFQNEN